MKAGRKGNSSGTVLLAAWRAVHQVGADAEEIEALAVKKGFRLAADEHEAGAGDDRD
jgi:hypothetical protein